MSERKLFGTDGIRGRANAEPMTPELALRLGRAIALVSRRGKTRAPRIVIGKDTRLSGYMLETALAAGICAMGGRVMLSGPIPTPAVANLTQSMRADAGVVISASHNPFADNGIKIFGPDGFKLPDTEELAIEALLANTKLDTQGKTGAGIGRAERFEDAIGRYIVYAKSTFPKELALDGLKIVVDAAHGAAYRVAPAVFAELGAEVIQLGCRPNGVNINRNCGALHPEHVAHEVKRRGAQLGVALDGDADRVIFVDEKGQIVDGDAIMALCATRMIKRKQLQKKTLVTTVMSNMGLERALEAAGGKTQAHQRRRPLRGRRDAPRRLQLRRRAVRSLDLPRSRHDRRRHRGRAAGDRDHAPRIATAERALAGDEARAAGAREREAARAPPAFGDARAR